MLHQVILHLAYAAVMLVSGGALGYLYGAKVKSNAVAMGQNVAAQARVDVKKVL